MAIYHFVVLFDGVKRWKKGMCLIQDNLPLYGIFVVHRFLRYLFHIQIRNSIELEKNILQYIVVHYFKRELYIASANLTNLDLSKIVGFVPK